MSNELSGLITTRFTIKSQLTRAENCLKTINSQIDLECLDLDGRLTTHLSLWDKFNEIQSQIEAIADKTPENVAPS